MAQDQAAVEPEVFGPYLVYERLGVGGMATVHRAEERAGTELGRVVALKRLLPHLAEDASFVKSFVREAKLASLLTHPNVVRLFELGRVGTTYFISMEYIEGKDLRQILRHARRVTGPPPLPVSLSLLSQACAALEYAHQCCDADGQPLELVHRDISPSNLIVNGAGVLKVIDFGIARAQSAHLRTQTGRVKGKLAYMAPESIAGKPLDRRSDVFSLGVVAHELMTARPLFAQKNEYQTLLQVQRGEVAPPSAFNPAVRPELDALILRALAKDPDDRWPSAGDMGRALAAFLAQQQLPTSPGRVGDWIRWAWSRPAPAANGERPSLPGFGTGGSSLRAAMVSARPDSTPPPAGTPAQGSDDDEIIELAWGADGDRATPVALDEVPDVSQRIPTLGPDVLAPSAGDLEADAAFPEDAPTRVNPASLDDGPALPHAWPAVSASPRSTTAPPYGVAVPPLPEPAGQGDLRPGPDRRAEARARLQRESQALVAGPRRPTLVGVGVEVPAVDGPASTPRPASPTRPRPLPSQPPPMGTSLARRAGPARRNLLIAGAGVALAVGGLVWTLRTPPAARPPPGASAVLAAPARALLKFKVEPADVSIRIDDGEPHLGGDWQVEVAPGPHQVEIRRDGYRGTVHGVELSANETHSFQIRLDRLDRPDLVAAGDATATDPSTPTGALVIETVAGLEVELDGEVLPDRTPATGAFEHPIAPGPHQLRLLQDGREVYATAFLGRADQNNVFTPSFSDQKRRERAAHRAQSEAARPDEQDAFVVRLPDAAMPATRASPSTSTTDGGPAQPAAPPVATTTPPPAGSQPPAERVAPSRVPSPPRAGSLSVSGPVTVPPNTVARLTGAVPSFDSRAVGTASAVSAKICIGAGGRVTRVDILGKASAEVRTPLAAAIRTWTYQPYQRDGVATPACFVTTFALGKASPRSTR